MALLIWSAVGLVIEIVWSQSVQGEEENKNVVGVSVCIHECVSQQIAWYYLTKPGRY